MPVEKTILKMQYVHSTSTFMCPYCSRMYELDAGDEETPTEIYSNYTCEMCGKTIQFYSIDNDLVLKELNTEN